MKKKVKSKVIKDLEEYRDRDYVREGITYFDDDPRYRRMIINNALALLKEQEPVEPFHKCIGEEFSLIEDSYFDYCPYCGKPITWAKQEGR